MSFLKIKLVEAVLCLQRSFLPMQKKVSISNTEFLLSRLSVQLNLRTFASSGLIYYMAHQNQVDYAALQLHGGQLYFSFDLGRGKAVAFHPAVVNDGKWHTVGSHWSCTPFSLPWCYLDGFSLPFLCNFCVEGQTGFNPVIKPYR